jgi:hypothetical protein
MTTTTNANTPMTMDEARSRLLKVWLWSIVPFGFVTIQTCGAKYGTTWPDFLDGLSWVLGLIVAPVTIIYGGSRVVKLNNARSKAACNEWLFRHCYWLSIAFIVLITAVPVLEPWLVWWTVREALSVGNNFLQPVQWFLIALLISFFLAE